MVQFHSRKQALVGEAGSLKVSDKDEVTRKLAMLIEGECEGLGPVQAAKKFGYTRQRYFQLRAAFLEQGATALADKPRGPKRNYRRTSEVVRQVIRHRFLDADASAQVIGQKLRQAGWVVSTRSVERVIADYGLQKKLYKCRPREDAIPDFSVQARRTRSRTKPADCDPLSLERGVRQLLADKVSGHLVGVWLLVAEHLRLGTWDLLRAWTGQPTERAEPRLAMQLVHEAALCTTGIRSDRTLTNRGGFELAAGLPFVASDSTLHDLLAERSVEDSVKLQVALGQLRRASGDYRGKVLAIDPHRVRSYSQRQMRMHAKKSSEKPIKMAQTFWLLDADTEQPVCFTTGTSSRTVAQVTPQLLRMAHEIFGPQHETLMLLADMEHQGAELLDHVAQQDGFEMLVPMANNQALRKQLKTIPAEAFTRRWAGFATMKQEYRMKRSQGGPFYQYVQRSGERMTDWRYKAFLSTADGDEVEALTQEFPKRWHIEEFFNLDQALGWKRAGTMNLEIRYGQMTMALLAQAAIHQLRMRLGEPINGWNANHLAKDLFQGLDGDVRVRRDTILVTYYNAPNQKLLRTHYQDFPDKLAAEHIDPQVPWLYGFKLDFRFK